MDDQINHISQICFLNFKLRNLRRIAAMLFPRACCLRYNRYILIYCQWFITAFHRWENIFFFVYWDFVEMKFRLGLYQNSLGGTSCNLACLCEYAIPRENSDYIYNLLYIMFKVTLLCGFDNVGKLTFAWNSYIAVILSYIHNCIWKMKMKKMF